MMPPIEGMPEFPSKCPLPNCKAKLHREWVLGVAPRFVGLVNVIIRCKGCKRVYGFTMPTGTVEPFLDSLSSDDSPSFKLTSRIDTPITEGELKRAKEAFGPEDTQDMIEAFSEIDEYEAFGSYEGIDDLEE